VSTSKTVKHNMSTNCSLKLESMQVELLVIVN